ncbi:MAG: reprolysin-like metallopeptidase, partial [Dokdonella sp.]
RALPAGAPTVSLYRPLHLDVAALGDFLAQQRASGVAFTLALPAPDGSFSDFQLVDSRTMPKALADKYPGIISLSGSDSQGRKARIDFSVQGFQAMVFEPAGIWVVRPETLGGGSRYLSFRREDLAVSGAGFQCEVHDSRIDPSGRQLLSTPAPMTQTGTTQRDYRAAVAANHNYVGAVCSGNVTVECGLAAVVQAMNRVNQVYETELAVHMTLIANNDDIIYPTSAGDPYPNDGGALDENISNLSSVIGNANFDIGHVFTTGSGGVAELRATCTSDKAGGTTGLSNPTGDAFYIDYVAHEMGHQFGGNHTFNSTSGSCGGGNRAGSAAYEPGSGSTIMAYAGICGANDLQPHSDPYFHAKSLDEINIWIGGTGGACAAATPNPDAAPAIDSASLPGNVTIPMHTPFALGAVATDADGDALSYNWEQYDLGPATTLAQGDTGAGPIFRSFNATTSSVRTFPKIESVLGATLAKGEAWPVTERNLKFRLTVRDNHDVPGTPQFGATQSADVQIHVTTAAGPFLVTRPNTALTWGRGETHLVTWDVAGTDAAPISCSNVAIDLSSDGGQSWPFALSPTTPNVGTASIVVPGGAADSTQARVRVACVDNVFFDVSDVNFSIAATGDPDPAGAIASISPTSFSFAVDAGSTASDVLTIANVGDASTTLNYTIAESDDACATTTDVSWLAATPTSGAVAGAASAPISVNIDATLLGVGSQSASLCVGTDDPAHAQFVVPIAVVVSAPADDDIFKNGFEAAVAVQPVLDPSFEATAFEAGPNPDWAGTDSNPQADPGATPFYSVDGSGIPTRTGVWAIWFGGWGGGAELQTAAQNVTIPAGAPRFLNYWRLIDTLPDAAGTLSISIDGTVLSSLDMSTAAVDSDFVQQSVDIGTYADGGAHLIEIDYSYGDTGGTGEDGVVFIDDVTIDATGARSATPAAPTQRHPGALHKRRH